MNTKKTLRDIDPRERRVLVRVDFNVPIDEKGNILDDSRIRASLKTINYLIDKRAKVILMSHLDRPKGPDPRFSLANVAERLSRLLNKEVKFVPQVVGELVDRELESLKPGEVLLLENVRFHPGETKNDEELAKKLASYCDIFVNDAFGTAHRKHASTYGVALYVKESAMGFLMEEEVEYFFKAFESPVRPFVALIGGAKVSSKLGVIRHLIDKVDKIIIGGAMAFTFLKARGYNIGKSLVEDDYMELARELEVLAKSKKVKFYLPVDFVVATEVRDNAPTAIRAYQEIPANMMGLDIGPATLQLIREILQDAQTIIWNGPFGVFELERFRSGSVELARLVANLGVFSVAGGGETEALLNVAGVRDRFSHVSTGGGAFLELLEKGTLPCIEVLNEK
ncbi:MAG: phosphoglycerate kinase [Thermosulfidibacteraceae bacterium]|jgi:phosphoglycerate kinase